MPLLTCSSVILIPEPTGKEGPSSILSPQPVFSESVATPAPHPPLVAARSPALLHYDHATLRHHSSSRRKLIHINIPPITPLCTAHATPLPLPGCHHKRSYPNLLRTPTGTHISCSHCAQSRRFLPYEFGVMDLLSAKRMWTSPIGRRLRDNGLRWPVTLLVSVLVR